MRKLPTRPDNRISQSYNDGVVSIYTVEDKAAPGYRPVAALALKVALLYDEQRLGLTRHYAARQNQVDVQRVLRVQRRDDISTQDVAVTQDGKQYRIDLVQTVPGVWPPSLDLTLAKTEQIYEVPK